MLLLNLLGFLLSCIFLVKSSELAIKSISNIAKILNITEFLISFVIIGLITSLPETSVSVLSAINKVPEIGFGTLLGSNIADLSLILGMTALIGRKIKIKSKTKLHNVLYLVFALVPIILAYDGILSRNDGLILIVICILFLLHVFKWKHTFSQIKHHYKEKPFLENIFIFLASILILYFSASYVIKFTQALSSDLEIPAILIALILIALGTCLPELILAIKSIKLKHPDFGLGDILGNVIIDATLILGITSLISPIHLERITVLVTGAFLILTVVMPITMIRYRKALTQKDGFLLILTYILFVFVETSVKGIF